MRAFAFLAALVLCSALAVAQPSLEAERIARLETRMDAMIKATQKAEERREAWERWFLGIVATGVATGLGTLIRIILTEPRRRRALGDLLSIGDEIRRSGDDIRRTVERVESAGFIDPMPRLIVPPSPIFTEGRIRIGPVQRMPPLIRPR